MDNWKLIAVLIIPLLGTVLGSAMVFVVRKTINRKLERFLLGFAAGVMTAASVWSLLIPAFSMTRDQGRWGWWPIALGFMLGIGFLLLLDSLTPHLHTLNDKPEGVKSTLSKRVMMFLAVTLHNIPEGMTVGVTLAGSLLSNGNITFMSVLILAIGIAMQNFPEGAIISLPLVGDGMSKGKAFLYGTLSGVVEPLGALVTILLTQNVIPLLPYFLSFAAGAMIYVVVDELIPEAQSGEHSNIATIGVAIGFVLMMILDVALG